MRTLMICLVASTTLGACYRQYEPAEPQYSYGGYGDSQVVQGPPGGEMDPGYGYEDPNNYAGDAEGADAAPAPTDDQTVTGTVTDAEIDTTLAPHGQWVVEAGYGRVWRPHTTVVGVDFTPYETCGSWIYTDYGWTFSCDWDWGWLPFHYGQWAWFDTYWGWCPGYQWSPAWVEWRSNDRYVGWRPRAPIFRDHRGGSRGGVVIRDHRRPRDRDWRFLDRNHLGGRNIRQHTFHRADAVRDTVAGRPPIAAPRATPVRDVIRGRPVIRDHRNPRGPVTSRPSQPRDHRGPYNTPSGGYQPRPRGPYNTPQGGYQGEPSRPSGGGAYQPRPRDPGNMPGTYQPPRGTHSDPGGPRPRGPGSDTYQPPRGPYNTPQGGYQPPRPRGPYNTPQGGYQGESSPRPSGGAYQPRPSGGGYQPPARPSGGYQPSRPSGGGYQPPARSNPTPRSSGSSYSPPSRSSGSSSSPPSRSSGSSYSPPSRSSGSSYSPPSRSSGSSHSAPSRSSGSSGGFGRRR